MRAREFESHPAHKRWFLRKSPLFWYFFLRISDFFCTFAPSTTQTDKMRKLS